MTKKELIFGFLETVTGKVTLKEAWSLFEQQNPGYDKGSFSSYRSAAIREGVFEPVSELQVTKTPIKPVVGNVMKLEVETVDVKTLDPNNFVPLKTNTAFDTIASKRFGIMRGTQYIVTGESGAGKTTLCTNVAQYLKEANKDLTAGFISCEMVKTDWEEEVLDNPNLGPLETVFMLQYLEASNYVELLEEALQKWDFVILDSFEVVIDQLKEIKGWTAKKAESELINMMRKATETTNNIIFAIQQYTKGGTFVGSNKIKHMLTGLIYVKFDKNDNRYVYFDKNRRGGHMVGKQLYFNKNKETGMLEFDDVRFKKEQEREKFANEELDRIKQEDGLFDNEIIAKAKAAQERRTAILGKSDTHVLASSN